MVDKCTCIPGVSDKPTVDKRSYRRTIQEHNRVAGLAAVRTIEMDDPGGKPPKRDPHG